MMKVHEVAKDVDVSAEELIEILQDIDIAVEGPDAELSDPQVAQVCDELGYASIEAAREENGSAEEPEAAEPSVEEQAAETPDTAPGPEAPAPEEEGEESAGSAIIELKKPKVAVKEFAQMMGLKPNMVIAELMKMNIFASINAEIDLKVAKEIGAKHGFTVRKEEKRKAPPQQPKAKKLAAKKMEEVPDSPDTLLQRPPVVTFMGHVDHGKTSLLDQIRNTRVTAGESGGITQHIGAYTVEVNDHKITFLDTPGHAAFTAMRARGANLTDIAVLVVAADDGVMPQTVEAIKHAQAAGVCIIIAMNKMDLRSANPDRLKQQLQENEIMVEDWGGSIGCCPVSATTGEGIDGLLERIVLESEMLELKANPNKRAKGVVLEAQLTEGRGVVATFIVQEGTLKRGDSIVVGACSGRVRSMEDERGRKLKSAGPSMPVVVTGLNSVPQAGDELIVVGSDAQARRMAEQNKLANKEKRISIKSMTLEDFYSLFKDEGVKELPLVVKADVDGSLEAILGLLGNIGNSEVKVNIVHSGIGAITENDVILAEASGAVVIGFNVKLNSRVKVIAKSKGVDINLYDVIYELSADVKASLEGLLEPEIVEERVGVAEVRQLFKVPKIGFIAGSYVKEGVFQRGLRVDVQRAGEVIGTGKVSGLRRFKDDAKEVVAGFECGIEIAGFKDFAEGDILIAYETKTIKRRLE